jgi:energy-converting hydrogenase Eha subunit H
MFEICIIFFLQLYFQTSKSLAANGTKCLTKIMRLEKSASVLFGGIFEAEYVVSRTFRISYPWCA